MRWLLGVGALAAVLGVVNVGAQTAIIADVTLEPQRVMVGDRVMLTVVVEHDSDVIVSVSDDPEAFQPLDLIEVLPPATNSLGGGRSESTFSFELAAFLIGEIELNDIAISVDGVEVLTVQPDEIVVESVLPPDAPLQLKDLKAPLEVGDGLPTWIWAALFMTGFAVLSAFTMALARVPTVSEPPVSKPAPSLPAQSPNDAALEAFDKIAEASLLDREELPEYYRRIGDGLRTYIARRYRLPAGAMTPTELEERLEATSMNKLAARQAVATLEQCQSVQFAGYIPARERAEADLLAAAEIVRLTSDAEDAGLAE